ncbi:MBL fold hydrolase [Streptomyces daqingensis]|uniref:MBL fold hydrolase n=1 Tax=Streptomyces daqingensis TaxID=1472640 RepID=A0ABQ2M777_9ACTN|nr:MBL fold metallo-hydrolase [Streptomyces daqingensis]GGO47577.1 MBL fold hydrolase [Streptomyces daqingensis]
MAAEREDAGGPAARERSASGWEELAPGVVRRRLPRWDATVGAVRGTSGLLLVDAGASVEEGARVRDELLGMFGLPVTRVVLTHPHFDHVLGAASFTAARVYAAAGMDVRLAGAGEELRRDAEHHGMPGDEAAASAESLAVPGHAVRGELTLSPGGREVVLVDLGAAHSPHDLAVVVRGTGEGGADGRTVVFCGDLVEESGEPQAGPDASPALWPAALDRLLSLGGQDALYVPGHGAVVDAAFVRAQRDGLARRFAQS